ncbi:hypothetical protein MMC25_007951 [Agyrium rufum]|nr:hypothetical protein [Agyrium rufum]
MVIVFISNVFKAYLPWKDHPDNPGKHDVEVALLTKSSTYFADYFGETKTSEIRKSIAFPEIDRISGAFIVYALQDGNFPNIENMVQQAKEQHQRRLETVVFLDRIFLHANRLRFHNVKELVLDGFQILEMHQNIDAFMKSLDDLLHKTPKDTNVGHIVRCIEICYEVIIHSFSDTQILDLNIVLEDMPYMHYIFHKALVEYFFHLRAKARNASPLQPPSIARGDDWGSRSGTVHQQVKWKKKHLVKDLTMTKTKSHLVKASHGWALNTGSETELDLVDNNVHDAVISSDSVCHAAK